MVVISIIGILAALLLANFAGIRDRADDARLKNNLKQVQTALRMRYNDLQAYPAALNAAAVTGYMNTADLPTIASYTYTTDTFTACVNLSNVADGDGADSRTRCGAAAGAVGTNYFCVCSN